MTTADTPRVSVVVPAYNEGEHIIPVLDRLFESVRLQCEVLIVVDSEEDDTIPVVAEYSLKEPRIRCLVNTYGRGSFSEYSATTGMVSSSSLSTTTRTSHGSLTDSKSRSRTGMMCSLSL